MNQTEMHRLVSETCSRNHFNGSGIIIRFNGRLSRTIGRAQISTRRIELSTKKWAILTEEEKRIVVIHEVCHIIAWHLYNDDGHGRGWKICMRAAGIANPQTRMNLGNRGTPRRRQRRYQAYCDCGTPHPISGKIRSNILNYRATYSCLDCGGPIRLRKEKCSSPNVDRILSATANF